MVEVWLLVYRVVTFIYYFRLVSYMVMLLAYMKKNGGEIGKTEMGVFANRLHEGEVIKEKGKSPLDKEVVFSYNKRQFYDRILTPMRGMGLIDYDLYKKTYRISDKFNKMMIKIGLMWLREMEKK